MISRSIFVLVFLITTNVMGTDENKTSAKLPLSTQETPLGAGSYAHNAMLIVRSLVEKNLCEEEMTIQSMSLSSPSKYFGTRNRNNKKQLRRPYAMVKGLFGIGSIAMLIVMSKNVYLVQASCH